MLADGALTSALVSAGLVVVVSVVTGAVDTDFRRMELLALALASAAMSAVD